jgi:hypothetical protein
MSLSRSPFIFFGIHQSRRPRGYGILCMKSVNFLFEGRKSLLQELPCLELVMVQTLETFHFVQQSFFFLGMLLFHPFHFSLQHLNVAKINFMPSESNFFGYAFHLQIGDTDYFINCNTRTAVVEKEFGETLSLMDIKLDRGRRKSHSFG